MTQTTAENWLTRGTSRANRTRTVFINAEWGTYERIGPAASHICNGRTSHQRHESPKESG